MAESQIEFSKFKRLQFFKRDAVARAVSSKLIHDSRNRRLNGQEGKQRPDDDLLNKLSQDIASNIEDASAIFQVLPDVRIAMDIWTSSILAPKDFISETLIWETGNNHDYNSQLFREMLDVLRQYFTDEYDLTKHLKPAVEDALFKTGSYPLVVIPESSLDDIINGKTVSSTESFMDSYLHKNADGSYGFETLSILGQPGDQSKVGVEGLLTNSLEGNPVVSEYVQIHDNCTITDNPDALKFQLALKEVRKQAGKKRIKQRYGMEQFALSLEDNQESKIHRSDELMHEEGQTLKDKDQDKHRFDKQRQKEVVDQLYQTRVYSEQGVVTVKTSNDASRLPSGHPLVMKLNSSSIIPVHTPGDPTDIVGAFIVLDEYGNPIDRTQNVDIFKEASSDSKAYDQYKSSARNIIQQMNFNKDGTCCGGSDTQQDLNQLAEVYTSLFEQNLISRLANGIYGQNVKISRANEVFRIMFARALGAMRTQLLYVPAELLTYFAFDYDVYGIGKSLLRDIRNLAGMRSALMYADIFGSIQNSIGRRKLLITLDEEDPDPEYTIDTVRTNYNRVNAFNLPLINQNPADVVNQLRESNIDTVIEGDNRAIPTTKVDTEDYQLSRPIPDDTTQDKIKRYFATALGMPATFIDSTENAQFAVTEINSHALFNKQAYAYQQIVSTKLLWDFVSKYTLNSGTLIKELSHVIKDNVDLLTAEQKGKGNTLEIIEDFLDALVIKLPMLESTRLEDQQKDFDTYKSMIENMIDGMFDDDLMAAFLPESLKENQGLMKSILKSSLLSKYVQDNQFLPVLTRYLDLEDNDNVLKSELKAYFEPLAQVLADAMLELDRISKISNSPELNKVGEEQEASDSFGSSDSSSDSSDSGGDDFGMGGDDMGMGDEPSEDGEEGGDGGFNFDI